METLRVEAAEGRDESSRDEYLPVCREVTMLQAHATQLLGRIDADGSFRMRGI